MYMKDIVTVKIRDKDTIRDSNRYSNIMYIVKIVTVKIRESNSNSDRDSNVPIK